MKEYWIWNSILNRCLRSPKGRPSTKGYKDRGVQVARVWLGPNGFENFYRHIGPRPTEKHTIDRIDSKKGYVPGNVRWVTMQENQRNRADNVNISAFGRTQCVTAWATETGIKRTTLSQRIRLGWLPEDALTVPPDPRRQKKVIAR